MVVVEQDVVLKGELGLRRSAWMPDHVRPPVTERLGGQPLRKRSGNNVLWIAVQFEDRGVESSVRRGLIPPLPGHPEAGARPGSTCGSESGDGYRNGGHDVGMQLDGHGVQSGRLDVSGQANPLSIQQRATCVFDGCGDVS